MGFRFRKSFKIGPARMTISKSGISQSIGVKGLRFTRTARGKTKTTVSIPGSGVSMTSGSKSAKKQKFTRSSGARTSYTSNSRYTGKISSTNHLQNSNQMPKRITNPPKPPKSPGIYRTCGIILIILGILMLFLFWPIGLIAFSLGVYYLVCGPKIYAKLVKNYILVHPEFEEELR